MVGGLLLEVLIVRLNPDLQGELAGIAWWLPVWAAWGVVTIGLGLGLLVGLGRLLLPRLAGRGRLELPLLLAIVLISGGLISRVNADVFPRFVSGTDHRTLGQDAITWLLTGVLVFALGSALLERRRRLLATLAVLLLAWGVPVARLVWQPTPVRPPQTVGAQPLGATARPLLVVGIEGLDPNLLAGAAGDERYRHLRELVERGSWGPLDPHRPFLRRSLWTTTATGCFPRRHGVRGSARWLLFGSAVRTPITLLPRIPFGRTWVLPFGLAEPLPPSLPAVPPLWERLQASKIETTVVGWPGPWPESTLAAGAVPRDLRRSLEAVLQPFPAERDDVWQVVRADAARVAAAQRPGVQARWLELESLAVVRRHLEPLRPQDTAERAVEELVLELLDDALGRLVDTAGPDALIVVVSPYGYEPPDAGERMLRILGLGEGWRASPEGCPDGVVVLSGPGVRRDRRISRAQLADVVPTISYLLGLPVAQYMDGRVVLEAVEPAFLHANPLRVVD